MTIQYTPRGVCSRSFTIQVEDGVIRLEKAEDRKLPGAYSPASFT